jgi:predicted nucleic acid-binding protein
VSLVLADTSVWVAHFRRANPVLQSLLETDQALCHPLIQIELACGTPPAPRGRTLSDIGKLGQAVVATADEILSMVESKRCYDTGCGAIDVALLASVLLTPDALLWTMDRNLAELAARLQVDFSPDRIARPRR